MAKFDEKGTTPTFQVVNEKGYERIQMHDAIGPSPCAECGEETRWVSCALTAPLCSHECVDRAWQVYFERLQQIVAFEEHLLAEGKTVEEALDAGVEMGIEEFFATPSDTIN